MKKVGWVELSEQAEMSGNGEQTRTLILSKDSRCEGNETCTHNCQILGIDGGCRPYNHTFCGLNGDGSVTISCPSQLVQKLEPEYSMNDLRVPLAVRLS